ncbi:major facilitator superfamily transporter [Colletotrichum incanum]|uniref:Major facilitator superfamily transporter n=1 Tax=Colletotrichum incanum TaxID=1573173 RepID=A0A167AZL5_COLIC|nr:major facilitator superfamily transporter [Colletotrichum incanum]
MSLGNTTRGFAERPNTCGRRPTEILIPSSADSDWVVHSLSLPREVFLIFIVCMAQFCTFAAFMGTVSLLHVMGDDFRVSNSAQLAWLVAGFSLTIGTFVLPSGRLGDIFGYKKIFIIGLSWFALWSLIAGVSVYSSFTFAVISRVFQGIGPAACLPNALAILGAIYPPGHRKAMVFATFAAVAPVGGAFGPVFAGLFEMAWWPWTYWSLAIVLVLLAMAGAFAIPELPKSTLSPKVASWQDLVEELDVLGGVTGVTALVLFNFAWIQAPVAGWSSPETLTTLVLGILVFICFIVIEAKYAAKPLLPAKSLNIDVGFVLAVVVCGWATFGIWSFYLFQIIQKARQLPLLLSAAWWCPVAVAGPVASVVTGKLLGPLKARPSVVMAVAAAAFLVGQALLATVPLDQIYWTQTFLSIIIMPFGMDMSFPAATLILSDVVPRETQGIAASLVTTVVNYSIALGVGIASTVETQLNNGGENIRDEFRGFQAALYFGVGLCGAALIISLAFLARDYRRRGKPGQTQPPKQRQQRKVQLSQANEAIQTTQISALTNERAGFQSLSVIYLTLHTSPTSPFIPLLIGNFFP